MRAIATAAALALVVAVVVSRVPRQPSLSQVAARNQALTIIQLELIPDAVPRNILDKAAQGTTTREEYEQALTLAVVACHRMGVRRSSPHHHDIKYLCGLARANARLAALALSMDELQID